MDNSSLNNPFLVKSYQNVTSWYRVYSDGWVEQSSVISFTTAIGVGEFTVNLLIPIETAADVLVQCVNSTNDWARQSFNVGGFHLNNNGKIDSYKVYTYNTQTTSSGLLYCYCCGK